VGKELSVLGEGFEASTLVDCYNHHGISPLLGSLYPVLSTRKKKDPAKRNRL